MSEPPSAPRADEALTEPSMRSMSLAGWRRRLPLQVIAIEVFSIVLGVFLALAVNQWREQRAQEARAAAALANIEREIGSNLRLLETVHAGNLAVIDALDTPNTDFDTTQVAFTPAVQVQRTAWETASSIGVFTYADYDRVLEISELYEMLTVYRTMSYELVGAMMSGMAFAAAQGRTWDDDSGNLEFGPIFRLIVQVEGAVIAQCRAVLGVGETDHGDGSAPEP